MSKTVFITGTTSGLGEELVKKYIKEGWNVIATGRNHLKIEELLTKIQNNRLKTYTFDLNNSNKEILNQIAAENPIIDLIINNAGFLIKKDVLDITREDLYKVYNVNVFAVFEIIQELHSSLLSSPSPQILNIGSVGGIGNTLKFPQMSAYSSSKGALTILTECLAQDLHKYNIIVNSVSLGAVKTPMLQKAFPEAKRVLLPKEVSDYLYSYTQSVGRVSGQNNIYGFGTP